MHERLAAYPVTWTPDIRDAALHYAEQLRLQHDFSSNEDVPRQGFQYDKDDYNPYDLSTSEAKKALRSMLEKSGGIQAGEVDDVLSHVHKLALDHKLEGYLASAGTYVEAPPLASAMEGDLASPAPSNKVQLPLQLSLDLRPPSADSSLEAITFLRILKLQEKTVRGIRREDTSLNHTLKTLMDAVRTGNESKVGTYEYILSINLSDEAYRAYRFDFEPKALASAAIAMIRDGSIAEHVPQQSAARA